MPGTNTTTTSFHVDEAVKAVAEEGAVAAMIGVGLLEKHAKTRKEVGTKATFAAVLAVTVKRT